MRVRTPALSGILAVLAAGPHAAAVEPGPALVLVDRTPAAWDISVLREGTTKGQSFFQDLGYFGELRVRNHENARHLAPDRFCFDDRNLRREIWFVLFAEDSVSFFQDPGMVGSIAGSHLTFTLTPQGRMAGGPHDVPPVTRVDVDFLYRRPPTEARRNRSHRKG